jgi:hypothetical protein
MSKYGSQVDDYAGRTRERTEHAADVHLAHTVHHGNAGDAVRGVDGHRPDSQWEYEPVPTGQRGREAQADLRGPARDARGGDQSTARNQNTKR